MMTAGQKMVIFSRAYFKNFRKTITRFDLTDNAKDGSITKP